MESDHAFERLMRGLSILKWMCAAQLALTYIVFLKVCIFSD